MKFLISQGKVLQLTGEVEKPISCRCNHQHFATLQTVQ